jgi:hypothetical protein
MANSTAPRTLDDAAVAGVALEDGVIERPRAYVVRKSGMTGSNKLSD